MATTDFANETENCSIKKKQDREEEDEGNWAKRERQNRQKKARDQSR